MGPAKSRRQQDRERRHNEMRRRILKAAMKLFLMRGFENVTMRNIAAEIGYSPGTIYRYFVDKDEIFFALRGEGFSRFYEAQISARRARDPMRRLRQHAEAYVGFALDNPEYYDLMFMMEAPVERAAEREEWASTIKSLQLLRDDVQLAIDAGSIHADDPDSAVFAFWSLLHGVMALILRQRLDLHSSLSARKLAVQVVDFILNNMIVDSGSSRTTSVRKR